VVPQLGGAGAYALRRFIPRAPHECGVTSCVNPGAPQARRQLGPFKPYTRVLPNLCVSQIPV
jgi:hypothetical protein